MSSSFSHFFPLPNGTTSSLSIPILFPPTTDTVADETSPRFSQYSNSMMSFFPPVRSITQSPDRCEIIISNPSNSMSSSFSHFFPLPNGLISDTETDDCCSESNETPRSQNSYSIVSLFPPNRSLANSSRSENCDITIPTYPSIKASPRSTIRKVTFKDVIDFLKPKSSSSSKFNGTPPKYSNPNKKSIPSSSSTTKSSTILTTSFLELMNARNKEEFPLQMLLKATKKFAKHYQVGICRFGSIYRAIFANGQRVAIEHQNRKGAIKGKDYAETVALCCLNHNNIVSFLGFSQDSNNHALVYEYMENDTLHDHLHAREYSPLRSWAARIKVALEVASGIEYLHEFVVPPIIHNNINSSTILLDANMTAKVFDFSVCVKVPKDESLRGLDVYKFGLVLLEMLLGKEEMSIDILNNGPTVDVLDPKVPPPTSSEAKALEEVVSLAADCVNKEGTKGHPSMMCIVARLKRALYVCESGSRFQKSEE